MNLDVAPTPVAQLQAIRAAGFDHVRQPFDPGKLDVAALVAEVAAARSVGLAVIVDAHPPNAYKAAVISDRAARERFLAMWRSILSALPADGVAFELLNEPGAGWWPVQGQILQTLRPLTKAAIIASGENQSTLWDLLKHEPYKVSGVVYNFHFYSPMEYSHQGAPWIPKYAALKDIPYPGKGWGPATMSITFSAVRAWSAAHHVPVICDEFGAWSAAPGRDEYLWDVSNALQTAGIGRTLWQNGGFKASYDVVLLKEPRP